MCCDARVVVPQPSTAFYSLVYSLVYSLLPPLLQEELTHLPSTTFFLLSSLRVKFGTSIVLNAADANGVGAMSTGGNLPGGLESVSFEMPEWYVKKSLV